MRPDGSSGPVRLRKDQDPDITYNALMPIPQMQIYVSDPLEDPPSKFMPDNNFRVDFGFWDGERLIAVEIDGGEPEGYAKDVRRDAGRAFALKAPHRQCLRL